MSEPTTVSFVTRCPNGHTPEQHFEKATLQCAVESDSLQFYCEACNEFWSPTEEEISNLKERLKGH